MTTRGAPRRRKTLVAARASVGATIAPSVNAAAQPSPGTSACATTATTTIVKTTRPSDSRMIGATGSRAARGSASRRRGEQQRRQEDEQHEVRLEGDVRHPGDEPERQAAQHEQRRVGHADPARDLEQDRDDDQLDEEGGQDVHAGR